MTEEDIQKRDDARRTFGIICFFAAVPSLFAQDALVWRKQRTENEIAKIQGKKGKGRK